MKQYSFDDVVILHDKDRIPLSAMERQKRQGPYRYYGAQGVIDHVDNFLFDGEYVLIAEDGENLKSQKQDVAQLVNGKFWVNNHAHIATTTSLCRLRYFYYSINSKDLSEYITGSAQPKLSQASMRKMSFVLPNINTQDKILGILGGIDDKIKENERINKNLEQQAQALFQEWFISNPESSDWNVGTFSDIIDSMIAGDWGKESPQGNFIKQVYCIRGADIPEVKSGNKGKMPTRYILAKNYTSKHLIDGDVVIEISGGSPTQSTGRIAAISQSLLDRYDKGMVCTNFCKALKPKQGYSMFLYYYWQYLYSRNVFFSYENGTTGIKNLDISGFIETEPIVLPPFDLVSKFDTYCQSVFDMTFANGLESEQLSVIRDALLPKLMSGEIDVSDIDL